MSGQSPPARRLLAGATVGDVVPGGARPQGTVITTWEKPKPHARNAFGNALKPPLFPSSPGSFSLLGLEARFLQEPQLSQALLPPPWGLPWGDVDGGEIPLAGSGQDHDIPGKKIHFLRQLLLF